MASPDGAAGPPAWTTRPLRILILGCTLLICAAQDVDKDASIFLLGGGVLLCAVGLLLPDRPWPWGK